MSEEIIDMNEVTKSKTDQLNTEDLLPRNLTIKITKATKVNSKDQPLILHYEGDNGKPYKPCLIMRKLMKHHFAWGEKVRFAGKIITLHNDPEVFYGPEKTGGIRISGLSEIEKDCSIPVIVGRGRVKCFKVKKINTKPLNAITDDQLREFTASFDEADSMARIAELTAEVKAGCFDKPSIDKLTPLKAAAVAKIQKASE